MTDMKQSRFGIVSGFLIAVLAGLFFVVVPHSTQAMSSKPARVQCANPARIKMGSRVFYLPRPGKIQPTYIEPGTVHDLCHAGEPLEVNYLVAEFSLDLVLAEPDAKGRKTENGTIFSKQTLQLQAVHITPQTHNNFRTLYQNIKTLMELLNLDEFRELPNEHGFYTLKRKDRPALKRGTSPLSSQKLSPKVLDLYSRHNIYISDDAALLSGTNEPAIIACEDFRDTERCWTTIWDGEVSYTVRHIGTRLTPKEKWKELYKGILDLRASLLKENLINPP